VSAVCVQLTIPTDQLRSAKPWDTVTHAPTTAARMPGISLKSHRRFRRSTSQLSHNGFRTRVGLYTGQSGLKYRKTSNRSRVSNTSRVCNIIEAGCHLMTLVKTSQYSFDEMKSTGKGIW